MTSFGDRGTIFLGSQFHLGYRYFFQTDIAPALISAGFKPIGLMPITEQAQLSTIEDLPSAEFLTHPSELTAAERREWTKLRRSGYSLLDVPLEFLRGTGMSRKMNLSTVQHYRYFREQALKKTRFRYAMPALHLASSVAQRMAPVRRLTETGIRWLNRSRVLRPYFEKYKPKLVVAASPGWWPADYLLILEAKRQNVPVVSVIVGWDHTSSKGLSVAKPDLTICWSEIQKQELIDGCDLDPERVEPVGAAHFDFYHRPGFAMARDEFFRANGIATDRKLITFACSFVGMSSNVGAVTALADAQQRGDFGQETQLLIRLHPSHLKKQDEMQREVEAYKSLCRDRPNVHLQIPDFDNDTPQKRDLVSIVSVLKHSDVFSTVMSTMALEAAITGTPTVTTAIDPEPEWRWRATQPISQALEWPTHKRILESGSTITAYDSAGLVRGIRQQLENPDALKEKQRQFALREVTVVGDGVGKAVASRILQMAASLNQSTVTATG